MRLGLLFGLLMLVGISNYPNLQNFKVSKKYDMCFDNTHPFNRSKSSKLAFQILLFCLVIQATNDKCLESISSNVGILVRFDYEIILLAEIQNKWDIE